MRERLRNHLETTGMIPGGSQVLVAYSGGPDSTALLHLLHSLEVDVVAAHLHHGQRAEADDEMARCEAFCDQLGIPFLSGRADVPRIAADMKIGLEEAGRNARYQFFRQATHRLNADLVATGHTRDDQVETVLLNLVRGTGLSGIAGIPASRDGIVRPLLPFSRRDTRAYCEEHGLWFHDDPANTDLAFSRARIRLNVLPELRTLNPQADASICRLAEIAGEEDRFLDGAAAAALEQSEAPANGDLAFLTRDCEAAFYRRHLESLPAVLFKRAVRLAARSLGAELDFAQTLAVLEGLQNSATGSVTAEGGRIVIEWAPETVAVRDLRPVEPYRFPLTVPGETDSDAFGWQFTAFPESSTGEATRRASLETTLAQAKIRGSLYFRTLQPGDEMAPLGFDGRRKLADLMSEAGLTRTARARLPIVCDLVGPLWIPGVCVAERSRSKAGDPVIRVRFGPLGDSGSA